MVVDAHAVIKNTEHSHKPSTHFCSVITSLKTIIQHFNEDMGIDTVKIKTISNPQGAFMLCLE